MMSNPDIHYRYILFSMWDTLKTRSIKKYNGVKQTQFRLKLGLNEHIHRPHT